MVKLLPRQLKSHVKYYKPSKANTNLKYHCKCTCGKFQVKEHVKYGFSKETKERDLNKNICALKVTIVGKHEKISIWLRTTKLLDWLAEACLI